MTTANSWDRYCKLRCHAPSIGLALDISRMSFDDDFLDRMEPAMQSAFDAMGRLESGAIANPDENRMVGHYWLRAAHLAPTAQIRRDIETTLDKVARFARDIHGTRIRPPTADRFRNLLLIGIGGSALGPMFVSDALGDPETDRMRAYVLDNTDPEGIDRTLRQVGRELDATLTVVISKSGTTPETRNGMLLVAAAYEAAGLGFSHHAVTVTGVGSKLDEQAAREGWLARFPMWDWVGGRTSETSAVGLLPAALQGIDIDALLRGAAACDEVTRGRNARENPAALMALMWHVATGGRGMKDMVVLPYNDRLLLFSRYLQQLIMESLGKALDLKGKRVEQGLSVYGNKGSTDQHAYVQQLRDGINNFFVTFIRVLECGATARSALEVEPGITAGDYLHGFLMGTREALHSAGRQSMTLTIPRVDAFHVGVLIALFERTVGLYASLIGINAYHQPGVEAGKKAAAVVLDLQRKVLGALTAEPATAEEIAATIGMPDAIEDVSWILEFLAANGRAQPADARVCPQRLFHK